jgi:hypothetical protein
MSTIINHRCRPNIPLSTNAPLKIVADSHTPYIPPHPQRGTPYHRYVTLLLPQVSELSIPVVPEDARLGFDVRAFLSEHSLDGSLGGGAHMWREEWDETVSQIHQDVLSKCWHLFSPVVSVLNVVFPWQKLKNRGMEGHQNQTATQRSSE